jgi:hypothetical protein
MCLNITYNVISRFHAPAPGTSSSEIIKKQYSHKKHCTRKLMADLAHGGQDGREGEPAAKRTRLESVVPVPAPAKKKEVAKNNPTPPPPRPCPPPLWLYGQLPPTPTQRGRWAGSQNPSSSYTGGGPAWDNQHGGNRGAGRGNRGPLRGGKRGRWGRW